MAQIVTFFDESGREVSRFSGRGDLMIAKLFSECLVDLLRDCGIGVKAEITSDATEVVGHFPNLRVTLEEIQARMRQSPANGN